MKREGFHVARRTVSRLMRKMGLKGVVRGKSVRTTISDTSAPSPLDRVNRILKALRPNMLWLSDFTYVATSVWPALGRTWSGFVYVAPPAAPPPAASQSDRQGAIVIDVFA